MLRRIPLTDPATVRRIRVIALVVGLAVALWLPLYHVPYRVFQFTMVLVYAVAVLGLGLLTGYNGQISLGQGAFFAVGAYTAAVLMTADVPYLLTLPPAALLTFVLGFALGIPALRLHGLYLALVTLGVAVVTPPILKRFSGLTGGAMGLSISKPQAPGWSGLANDQWLYYLVLAIAVVLFALAWNLVHSRAGRAMVAIRDNELAASTMGVTLASVKTRAFAWGAMYAGVAGAMFTWVIGFVSPDSFMVPLSIELLAALVVGGLGTISGPLFGAAFLVFVPNVSQNLNDAAPGIAFGALLILAMYVAPGGIAGLGHQAWARLVAASRPGGPGRSRPQPPAAEAAESVAGDEPAVDATPRVSESER
ncbi:MAG TPA: branched-chain amino acid ABC transporter permease [Euzebyales bacterium]|nr:branched-chain amino acid ABC transporter permease [Euzebyales bacterium]